MENEIIPPDLTLIVTEERRGDGQIYLQYRVSAKSQDLRLSYRAFDSAPLQGDLQHHIRELFKDISHMPPGREASWLANRGAQLFKELVPLDLCRKLWELRGSVQTVQILSNEAWIPWELLTLQNPDDSSGDQVFLVEAFSVTRWLLEAPQVMRLPLQCMALVAPTDSGLPKASEERQRILSLAQTNREVVEIRPIYTEVERALGLGRYDGFHFAGHGIAWNLSSYSWSLLLDGNDQLTPPDLNGNARNLGSRQPLVFLNACQSGRGAASLTGLGGLASAFIDAGAGAFIGALWDIEDRQALRFAEEFYRQMLSGEEIGEAVRQARLTLRRQFPNGTGWLAYTVFGHPLTRCSSVPPHRGTAAVAEPSPTRSPKPERTAGAPATPFSGSPRRSSSLRATVVEPISPGPRLEPERPAEPRPGEESIHERTGMAFVFIPGGEFYLGAEGVQPFSEPVRRIRLSPFWIGKYPVTHEQYGCFLAENPGSQEAPLPEDSGLDLSQHPVTSVSWDDAYGFCIWAGLGLPTEAQWEAAARGTDQRPYPWGKELPSERHASFERPDDGTTPVGNYPGGAGPYGTLDQAGNVWEWCADPWDSHAYRQRRNGQLDPIAKAETPMRSVRGGSWNGPVAHLNAAYRDQRKKTKRFSNVGFRCVWRP